jgi:hypothetical protein
MSPKDLSGAKRSGWRCEEVLRDPRLSGVIPNLSRARALYLEDDSAFEGMAFGLARPNHDSQFAYSFGNPTVLPEGPRFANKKSAGVSVITVGPLQVWAVDPTLFRTASIRFPSSITQLREGLEYGGLQAMPIVSPPEVVVVNNGPHDIVELFERLSNWTAAQQAGGPPM